jgi:predicted CoA-substrate-specific enzyme activase
VSQSVQSGASRSSHVHESGAHVGHTAHQGPFFLGVDVGSTTVKLVACAQENSELLFRFYRKHESRQVATLLDAFRELESALPVTPANARLFVTGSGGARIAQILGGKFVQEVTAVSLAVELCHPEVRSVIELGGQDSKIIILQETALTGHLKKFASMNDKCAGGTGAVIERIAAKLNLSSEQLMQLNYDGVELHSVAGKCGVFAETDITGLQKAGVPPEQLMASLFDAIVLQNLSVLTRGHQLKPQTLLLGGPNFFFPGLRQAWHHHLHKMWQQEKVSAPPSLSDELILVPENAQYFAALGAIEYGRTEPEEVGEYLGSAALERALHTANEAHAGNSSMPGLTASEAELKDFLAQYTKRRAVVPCTPHLPTDGKCGPPSTVEVFLGIDGGSTSTKAVCLSRDGDVLASAYRLSQGDPVADAIAVLKQLRSQFAERGERVEILGSGTTGYSRDLLQRVFHADAALVETVAHANSAMRVCPDVECIVDVGGQDIKIICLNHGAVKDFRLNTQCSAGNGYFLQAAAESLGIAIEDFASVAFTARQMPIFSYGCAVFLQSDIVNFQRQGWQPQEIIAGLAAVLPKNVFIYVAGVSNIAKLGRRFLLQGGTQRNLAVVKAEVDFMRSHYFDEGEPEIFVHPNCGEAGAIGAALHVLGLHVSGRRSSFIGLDQLEQIRYQSIRNEETRCGFCSNRCSRTFLEVQDSATEPEREVTNIAAPHLPQSADVGEASASRRIILAACERGQAEDAQAAREFNASLAAVKQQNPNLPAIAARAAFQPQKTDSVASTDTSLALLPAARQRARLRKQRSALRIGIPKALNLYAYAPLFSGYFAALGLVSDQIVFSDTTTQEQYRSTLGLASVDPCFPSKVCISHVRNLLEKSAKKKLDIFFFPMLDMLTTWIEDCRGANACPAGAATPEQVKAAFSLSRDLFDEHKVQYVHPVLNLQDRQLFALEMYECWKDRLGLDWQENERAVAAAYVAQQRYEAALREESRRLLDRLEREKQIGLVLLGRPYHHDPGLNQGILDSLQQLGYPIFSQTYLPLDADLMERLFGAEVAAGTISSPFAVNDVWKVCSSAGTNHKLWAAKFAARHPNLIPVELSNFKCGHDAFISRVIEQITECAGKPHFCFRDLDENKPSAALKIRVETIDYFLKQYRKQLAGN